VCEPSFGAVKEIGFRTPRLANINCQPRWLRALKSRVDRNVEEDYIHKITVILCGSLQCEYHRTYGPPTSVTWLQLLRKQKNAGTSTAPTAETHWPTRTRLRALSRVVTSAEAH